MDAIRKPEAEDKSSEPGSLFTQQNETEIQVFIGSNSSLKGSRIDQIDDCVVDTNQQEGAEIPQVNLAELIAETHWESAAIQDSPDISVEDIHSITSLQDVEQGILTTEEIEVCIEKTMDPIMTGSLKTIPSANLLENEEGLESRDDKSFKRTNSAERTQRQNRKTSLLSRRSPGFSSISITINGPHFPSRESLASTLNDRLRSWLQPMDNKMNMKVFGSKKAMVDEQIRYRKAGWIIHPTSVFRLYWDLMILALLVVNMCVLPVAISFFYDDTSDSWLAFNSVCDAVFLMDIILNFRTGVLAHGSPNKFILDPRRIAIHYLRTWFLLDLISSIPLDRIVSAARTTSSSGLLGASRALRILRMVKLLSLLRLLRISRLVRYIHQYEEILNITRSFMRFANLISLMLLVSHWNGCLQFLVPLLGNFPSNSWVEIHNLLDKPWTEQYLWALFKALSHMLCIGYGRHPPQNIPEACVTIFSMLTGATFYALFIAYSINVIQQIDSPSRQFREKIQQIEEYMSYRKLPVNLRDKMTKYYEHRFQGKLFDEERILGEISRPLKDAIINFNCRDLVQAVPFFTDAEPDFVSAIITKLRFEVFLKGDVIIREGEMGTEMYFLKEGVVQITIGNQIANELTHGAYFGEICLLTNTRRTARVAAKSVCDVFILNAEDFREVVDEYPSMRLVMEKVAQRRLSRITGKAVSLSTATSREGIHVTFQSSRSELNVGGPLTTDRAQGQVLHEKGIVPNENTPY